MIDRGNYHLSGWVGDDNGTFEFAQLGGHRLTLGIYARRFETHIRQHDFKSFSDSVEIRLKSQQ